ncbi:transglycosylase SLT domain-containing protein [Ferrimonas balearica]|uniref:transglycosylase SLT domain-containing protein n=1 Tax=Ferrimonas balearica TaxID=44012 RepID=UPI001F258D54|nr:transglycosylase SLT domain-containing protein [Ferrimonas balearica]MBY6016476.1 transglycosylase SLT domain-containing protein [Halomonas denitrificans]MBY6095253.1 transglycosylase SLT domain-containing protein [Ferrimonas balearica]
MRAMKMTLRVLSGGMVLGASALLCDNVVGDTATEPVRRHALSLPEFHADPRSPHQEVEAYARRLVEAYQLDPAKAQRYAGYILESASYSGVPKELIAALIHTESHFRDQAESVVGAIGPAQIMPQVWEPACGDVSEPRTNVLCAGVVLAHYKTRFCEDQFAPYACALSHYNVGPGNLVRKPNRSRAAAKRYLTKMSRALAAYDEYVLDQHFPRRPEQRITQ